MTYYKIIRDNTVVDVNNIFLKWVKKHNKMVECAPDEANFVLSSDGSNIWTANGLIQCNDCPYSFEGVHIVEIDEEEYRVLQEQLSLGSVVEVDDTEDCIEEEQTTAEDEDDAAEEVMTAAAMRLKIQELTELVEELSAQNEMLEGCLMEISEIVYA